MTGLHLARGVALAGCTALIAGLLWLDQHRGGPANAMARCNLLLSRVNEPAAEVLLVGSSRSGVALDPVAMEQVLSAELRDTVRVDRLSLGNNPLRAMNALMENYLEARGAPRIVVLEIMFMTERSIGRLAERGLALAPEDYLYRRDVNLLDFEQLLAQPAVAMPFTTDESAFNLWSQRLRGVVLRAGALIYQAARDPMQEWNLSACARETWTREVVWPSDFAFSYGEFKPDIELAGLIEALESEVAQHAGVHPLQDWQSNIPGGAAYPYDFESAYRRGEVSILESMINHALEYGSEVVLLPLPLYAYGLDGAELRDFVSRFGDKTRLFDLYGAVRADFAPLWYDDAHVERSPVGNLTTALMAKRLLQSDALHTLRSEFDG